ncbi:MAG: ABC transporter substrate-binding protein [Alphaproteobacteria bacterium]|nr:ABC transporter substrate-binding protein [Alphaproteobacteria bacterium]
MNLRNNWATLAALGLAFGLAPAVARAAGEECVKIIGNESSGEKLTLDPSVQTSSDDAILVFGIYNRLVDLNGKFEVVPELAESWEASDDGKTWTFHLRQGVKFHDGSDFDANDVIYTYKRLIDPALASPAAAVLSFLTPEGITAIDANTVQFTTAEPIAELPLLFTTKFTLIVPEGATAEGMKNTAVGTGPFMVEKFNVSDPIRVFRKNPNYWKAGLPLSECLRITVAQEGLTASVALQSGEADLVLSVDAASIPVLKEDSNINLLETGAGTSMTYSMWIDKPPFDNLKVRQAMKLVVDRQALVDTVVLGFGEPGNDNPVPSSWPSAFTSEPLARDVEKAKALLAEAGYPDGLTIDLYTSEGIPGMTKFAEAYKAMAADAGITVNLNVTPPDSYWDDIWLKQSFVTSGWSIRPPIEGLSVAYTKTTDWNETHWIRDDFEALLQAARTELDATKRVDTLKQAQKLLAEEGGVIVGLFIHQVAGIRSACTGYEPHAQNFNVNYEDLACSD